VCSFLTAHVWTTCIIEQMMPGRSNLT